MKRRSLFAAAALVSALVAPLMSQAQGTGKTLRVVPHSNITILDPIWTTAFVTRNHGYMIYDTLFGTDLAGKVKPQMVDTWKTSDDGLVWTFTLRDGLEWHDGKPVTAEDCVASLKRWSVKDSMGVKLASFLSEYKVVDAKTFQIVLKEKFGPLLQALGKPSVAVPFMMPKRVAETDPNTQISEYVGSGPFVLKLDEWKPGEKIVFLKNSKYKPRSEPASGLAGGKVVSLDRVEWVWIPDAQTQVDALIKGEIDMIGSLNFDNLPLLEKSKGVKILKGTAPGQFTFRPNWLQPPFNDVRIRRAAAYALSQPEFMQANIGDDRFYRPCKALFTCDTPYASTVGMDGLLDGNIAKAKELLAEAKYDGTPVVMPQPTDLGVIKQIAPVAKAQLERAGFKVDMQSMDWQTVVGRRAKKDPPNAGGWNAFLTSWVAADILNPVMAGFFNASCDKAMFGWPCDEKIEKMRDEFSKETDPAKQKQIAIDLQKYWVDNPTHINVGQWYAPMALRKNIDGILIAPVPVFWNVSKK